MATGNGPRLPERPPGRLRLPAPSGRLVVKAVIGAVLVAYSWLAASTTPFTRSSLLIVLLPGAVVGVIAYGWPVRRIPAPDHLDLTGSVYWVIAIGALFEWEASAFRDFTDTWHPPLSNLVNPVIDVHPLKMAAMLTWLLAGWGLVRR
jgi:4-hydroxybenzoate polyprenyltransferase